MSYEKNHLGRLQDIKEHINRLNSIVNANGPEAHNRILRGANLGTSITAAQIANIKNGTFKNLYLGDYWSLPIDGTTTARIMHFLYWGGGVDYINNYGRMGPNHAIVQLFNGNWNYAINDTATTEGGLLNSKLWTEILPEILSMVKAVIGEENIFARWKVPVCDAVDATTGLCSHRTTVTSAIFMPSAYNVLPYHDNDAFKYAGNNRDLERWAFYDHRSWRTINTFGFWLDTPASKTAFYQAYRIWSMLGAVSVYPTPSGDARGLVAPYILLSGVA